MLFPLPLLGWLSDYNLSSKFMSNADLHDEVFSDNIPHQLPMTFFLMLSQFPHSKSILNPHSSCILHLQIHLFAKILTFKSMIVAPPMAICRHELSGRKYMSHPNVNVLSQLRSNGAMLCLLVSVPIL